METICSQHVQCGWTALWCVVYDFQTLLTGLVAIGVAILAGIPVWRQLRDSNLQTRISHRETLANLLRDSLRRYARVDKSISAPLSLARRVTIDPDGEAIEISTEDAHGVGQMLHGVLDWYLVVLADTEHGDIEKRKPALKAALEDLAETLDDAHWADINDQDQDGERIPDEKWVEIVARCAEAKLEAADKVATVGTAYGDLREAQGAWTKMLRTQIAKLDQQIAAARP
jgi:hypothetical protein